MRELAHLLLLILDTAAAGEGCRNPLKIEEKTLAEWKSTRFITERRHLSTWKRPLSRIAEERLLQSYF